MNWADLGKTLLGLGLPTLGGLLAGPGGAAVGKVIAGQIGVPATPEALGKALQTDPEVLKKMQETEAEWARTEAERFKAAAIQSQGTNASIQSENAAGVGFWHWRHQDGYLAVLFGYAILAGFVGTLFFGKPTISDFKVALDAVWAPFTVICGLVGYVAMDTSRRTQAAATGTPITGILDIIGSVFKRK